MTGRAFIVKLRNTTMVRNLIISLHRVNRQATGPLPGAAVVDHVGCVAVELVALPSRLTLLSSPAPWCVQHRGLTVVPVEAWSLGRMLNCMISPWKRR